MVSEEVFPTCSLSWIDGGRAVLRRPGLVSQHEEAATASAGGKMWIRVIRGSERLHTREIALQQVKTGERRQSHLLVPGLDSEKIVAMCPYEVGGSDQSETGWPGKTHLRQRTGTEDR